MRLKETLQNIVTILEASFLETKKLREEVAELKAKINAQQIRILNFSQKLEDIKETNVETATLIEELAFHFLESPAAEESAPKIQPNIGKLYLVGKK